MTVVLGIDIGGTRTKWVHWSPEQGVLAHGEHPTPRTDPADVVNAVVALIEGARAGADGVGAVGVAVPGCLSGDRRRVELLPNLPGRWAELAVADELEARSGVRVELVNDARAFALAELRVGAAREVDDALFVTMGTGIGGALALNGRVVRGRGDAVGELGHMICRPGGAACGCGARGCLETVAGGWALVAKVRALGGTAETPEDVVRAAGPVEREVLDDAGRALGLVLSNVVAYTGVTTVVIGGGVAPAFAHMRGAVESALAVRERLTGPVELRLANLGPIAGAVGAAINTESSGAAISTGTSGAVGAAIRTGDVR